MMNDKKKTVIGRPKTFDRDHVINVAMQAYWQEGVSKVSLNSVCRIAKVSKPAIYKEFGSEDGLKQAVLINYHKMTLAPLYEMLANDQPFDASLEALIEYILRDHEALGMPNGCLFIDMRQCRAHLGELTGGQVDQFRELSVSVFEDWIARAKTNGYLKQSISPQTAAVYIDAQIACIMNMQKEGATVKDVSTIFRLALSIFDKTPDR